jgi:hypothetical protein
MNPMSLYLILGPSRTTSAFTKCFEFIPFFLLVDRLLDCSQSSFKKGQAAACRFSKEICANLRNLSTNRKKGILLGSFEKLLVN